MGAHPAQSAIRKLELKSTVRSLIVVMVDVFVQYPLEATAATNDQPVQTFASSCKTAKLYHSYRSRVGVMKSAQDGPADAAT